MPEDTGDEWSWEFAGTAHDDFDDRDSSVQEQITFVVDVETRYPLFEAGDTKTLRETLRLSSKSA